jgi:TetR/AcrR family transcriptional repressor of nem operon
MRVSREEKQRSHQRIVKSAARLLRERGVDATSVADVMTNAGLTHGGFYRHFETKEALTETALGSAFDQITALIEAQQSATGPEAAVTAFQRIYLSDAHAANPGLGCPIAALAGEIGRGTETLKAAFGRGVNRLVDRLMLGMPGAVAKRRERATRELAMMAGAIMIARASDPETARAVLTACRPKGASNV